MSKLQLAGKWYERKSISDGVTLIYEPHVHPFLRCNIWFIRGRETDLLIDTGLGVASLKDAITDLTDKPVTALATHIHFDHVGCLHEFPHRLLHESEAPRMSEYKEWAFLKMPPGLEDYETHGETSGFKDLLINAAPTADFDVEDYGIQSTTITRTLKDGDVVDLGNRHFEIMHLPGHSPGSIGLWEEGSGTFFSGDALYDGTLLDDLPDSNVPDYIQTMKRVRQLPVDVVHGGHEPSFGRERMHELVDAYLQWRDS
ncbi:MAG: glyoxylase-like metal-dependent hydrolase (beta-lactamase superfamily II) [Patiriisocius sp.]|jgi:glyoxylase-like metal-dependent hydrolase (beta-lactamase superfamily II)